MLSVKNVSKYLLTPLLLTPFTLTTAHADTILGIYAGIGNWNPEYSGDIGNSALNIEELGFDDDNYSFGYIALEHPIPILPNIRLQRTEMDTSETATLNRSFEFDNVTFDVNETVATDLDLSHTDVILYYEVLDNYVSVDLGINARVFDGEVTVTGENSGRDSLGIDATLPMLYGKVQFDIPATGFYVGADASFIDIDGDSLSDITLRGGYAFDSVVDLGVEFGYRIIELELDDLDDFNTDIEIDGFYGAVTFHFQTQLFTFNGYIK